MKAKVRATKRFEGIRDAERNVMPKEGEEWITSKERAEYLESKKVVEIIELIKEGPKKQTADEKPLEKKPAPRRRTRKSDIAKD